MSSSSKGRAPEYKLVLVGNYSVGKTSLILRYMRPSDTNLQIGEQQLEVELEASEPETREVEIDGRKVKVSIEDTRGQERFRHLTSSFYRYAAASVLVYDVTDRPSFEDIQGHAMAIRNYQRKQPLFLAANKCDLTKDKWQVSRKEGEDLLMKINADGDLHLVSAKTGKNVDKLMEQVVRHLIALNEGLPPPLSTKKKSCSIS